MSALSAAAPSQALDVNRDYDATHAALVRWFIETISGSRSRAKA